MTNSHIFVTHIKMLLYGIITFFFHFQICVPLPQRSLVIVQGQSRYEWQHSIHRKHIISRRLATTLRELTPDFMPGGKFYETTGRDILEAASNYQGSPVNFRT